MASWGAVMLIASLGIGGAWACSAEREAQGTEADQRPTTVAVAVERPYLLERIDDAAVVQLYADGFEALPLGEKALIWHLYQAALAGRDIFYDQRYAHNLEMREVLEEILTHSDGIDASTLAEVQRYTKLFWLNTGPYNNLTARKFVLGCSPDSFAAAARAAATAGAQFPTRVDESLEAMLTRLQPMFFDPAFEPVVTNKNPASGQDMLAESANNLYVGVTMADVEGFDEQYPLNSRLVKREGTLVEEVYSVGRRYDQQIADIVAHLEAAMPYATEPMARALRALARWYETGDPADRRAYDVAWVEDRESPVDTINGFVEVYMDPRAAKGSWEALVFYVNQEKTTGIRKLADAAQWFEDRMPWDPAYRKEEVQGITANAIDVVVETGDSGPITPVGINLPNDQFVRERHGSKSISLSNVVEAYDKSIPAGFRREFSWSDDEVERAARWANFASELTTNMHEVIGHASGKISESLKGSPKVALKEHFSALEEARADLVALYFVVAPKLVELGIVPREGHDDIVLAEYESYTRNALLQLRRVRQGSQLEEDHMRNRQMVVRWIIDNTEAVEVHRRDGKTYYVMVDREAFHDGVGRLLAEVQRIKAEGDYPAAQALFETYGIEFDPELRDEVVSRVDALHLPSYSGFVMPKLTPVYGSDGSLSDVRITYPQDLTRQMLEYSGKMSSES